MEEVVRSGDNVAREFARRLYASLGSLVQKVYCFGSWARGGGTADSDVDILVETRTPVNQEERNRIVDITMELSAASGYALDVHYYTTGELRSGPFAGTPFVKSVMEEALAL